VRSWYEARTLAGPKITSLPSPIVSTNAVALVCGGIGIAPALFSSQLSISGHRTLLGIAFVTVAAACGIDTVPWRRVRIALAISVVAVVAVQSLSLFVSRGFWPPNLADAFPYPQ